MIGVAQEKLATCKVYGGSGSALTRTIARCGPHDRRWA
jgi:hypothetical protein